MNSLTHMVVVVDDNANDNATAELEEQLGILGERWSSVCKWTEERYHIGDRRQTHSTTQHSIK